MRGKETQQSSMLCLMSPEKAVPKAHPIRAIKKLADDALRSLESTFEAMYAATGRPSLPPERLLKATLLMALYSVRSERQLCEQLDYNLLFRWFLDMDMVEPSFDHSTFTRNRERLLKHDVAGQFFHAVVAQARKAKLISAEHFSVDGTLIEAWASLKSFRKKDSAQKPNDKDPPGDGNRWVDFHGEKRSNETHESSTDPEARLMRKGLGKEAKLSYSAHALMENRSCLLVDFRIAEANGTAERDVALSMLDELEHRAEHITLGADKGYDVASFVRGCRDRGAAPHVAQNNTARRSAIDRRTTSHPGYSISQRTRKRIEEPFGWLKTIANFRKTRFIGRARTQLAAYINAAAYNLLRIARLLAAPPLPEAA
jgi:transposase